MTPIPFFQVDAFANRPFGGNPAAIMGIPGADDIMLNYQSTSFHDALYLRSLLGLKRAPEFDTWLARMGIADTHGRLREVGRGHSLLRELPYLGAA